MRIISYFFIDYQDIWTK